MIDAYGVGMAAEVTEQITVRAPVNTVYEAVADVRSMARWSPECFAIWVTRRAEGRPARFVGWNRRGPYLWFTTCAVAVAEHGKEFAFDVTTFGQPVSRWGVRLAETAGGTEVTEYWQDQRNGTAKKLGRVFTGKVAKSRPEANADGMRQTLRRLKEELEGA